LPDREIKNQQPIFEQMWGGDGICAGEEKAKNGDGNQKSNMDEE
jgi:hypothetical protein